jgi:DNA-binding NtrC family response regulator
MSASHVLVVDDEPDIRELIKDILDDEGYEVTTAENAQAARDARRNRKPDLVLLDIWMPDTDGISLLREWNDDDSHFALPVVMMSGHGSVETAVEATPLGAYDFLEKPLSMAKLLITVRRALENAQLKAENVGLRRDVANQADPLGRSATMSDIRERAKRIGRHDTAVLISGESGAGKAVLARYIHNQSARSNSPFVRVPVSGLTNARSASELFGVENNGAVHYGLLEQSNGGTLFLEDIVDMDLEVQARFLSALTQNAFLRVGALEATPIDVRIIAATSYDAALAVRDGRLREDLYYHLNVVPLDVPALRDHREDVPELIEYFVEQLVQHENLPYRRFGVAAQNRLRHYTWPGNVRELKNVVQRLLILSAGEEVQAQDVDTALGATAQAALSPRDADFELPLKEARERFERRYLEHRIREEQGNISRVAERVGVERTHLYRKFKSLQLDPKQILNDG